MTVDARQSLSYALTILIEVEEDINSDEDIPEEIERASSDIKTALSSLDFTAGRQISEEKIDYVIETIHECLVECSSFWSEYPDKREIISEEALPELQKALEELSDRGYNHYRQELDDRWGSVQEDYRD